MFHSAEESLIHISGTKYFSLQVVFDTDGTDYLFGDERVSGAYLSCSVVRCDGPEVSRNRMDRGENILYKLIHVLDDFTPAALDSAFDVASNYANGIFLAWGSGDEGLIDYFIGRIIEWLISAPVATDFKPCSSAVCV